MITSRGGAVAGGSARMYLLRFFGIFSSSPLGGRLCWRRPRPDESRGEGEATLLRLRGAGLRLRLGLLGLLARSVGRGRILFFGLLLVASDPFVLVLAERVGDAAEPVERQERLADVLVDALQHVLSE